MRAAELRMAGGDTEKGMAELERLAESPDTGVAGRALFLLGHAALRRDQEVTALKYFREAVKKDYAQPDIIAYVAADLIRQGEPVKAAGLIEEHDSILPFNAAVEETLVTGLIQAGRPDLAERHLLRHLERRGLDEHAQRMLAMLSEAQTAQ
jgi:Flp pilus assembly protein TadD